MYLWADEDEEKHAEDSVSKVTTVKLGQEKEEAEPLTRDDSWRQSAPVREWDIGKESEYCVLPALMHMKIHWLCSEYISTHVTLYLLLCSWFSPHFIFIIMKPKAKWVRDSHPANTILINRHFKVGMYWQMLLGTWCGCNPYARWLAG